MILHEHCCDVPKENDVFDWQAREYSCTNLAAAIEAS